MKRYLILVLVLISFASAAFGGGRTLIRYRPALDGQSIEVGTDTYVFTSDPRRVGNVGWYEGVPIEHVISQGDDRLMQQNRTVQPYEMVLVQGRVVSMPDDYGRTFDLSGAPNVTQPDDETVGTLPATSSDQDEPAVTTWTESHGTHTIKTHQLVNETDDKWAQRHARRVEALQRVYPPVPPTDH